MHRLTEALDHRDAPLRLFFRNDDAGWEQGRLDALLGLFHRLDLPIDLAVIPAALATPGAAHLNSWRRRHPAVGLHQHGYAHQNYEPEGVRSCEFGPSRPIERQCADIAMGRERLSALLGEVDPIFTPPWNRICAETIALLPGLGLPIFSDDGKAGPCAGGPRLVPVDFDWERERRREDLPGALGALLASAGNSAGIMLHHAVMDAAALAELSALLSVIRVHPKIECVSMRDVKEPVSCAA